MNDLRRRGNKQPMAKGVGQMLLDRRRKLLLVLVPGIATLCVGESLGLTLGKASSSSATGKSFHIAQFGKSTTAYDGDRIVALER